jgi:hypothetical protein
MGKWGWLAIACGIPGGRRSRFACGVFWLLVLLWGTLLRGNMYGSEGCFLGVCGWSLYITAAAAHDVCSSGWARYSEIKNKSTFSTIPFMDSNV